MRSTTESRLGRHAGAVIIGMCMEPIRLTQPSVLFGYYNHAVHANEGYFVGLAFMWPITASMAERRRSSRLMRPKTPRF